MPTPPVFNIPIQHPIVKKPVENIPNTSQEAIQAPTSQVRQPTVNPASLRDVMGLQKELAQINYEFATSGIIGLINDNNQIKSVLNKLSDNSKIKNKHSFLELVQALNMRNANNKNANVIDGKWGPLTNSAVNASLLISKAIYDFAAATGSKITKYTVNDIKNAYEIIKSKNRSSENVKQLTIFFAKVKDGMEEFAYTLKNNATKLADSSTQLIKSNISELTQKELQFIHTHKDEIVPQLSQLGITFGALQNSGALSQFLAQHAMQLGSNIPDIRNVLQNIKQNLIGNK